MVPLPTSGGGDVEATARAELGGGGGKLVHDGAVQLQGHLGDAVRELLREGALGGGPSESGGGGTKAGV